MTKIKTVSILGSTGSIGKSTLRVLEQHKDKYKVIALTGWKQVDILFEQCLAFQPEVAIVADELSAYQLEEKLRIVKCKVQVQYGPSSLVEVACAVSVDIVMAAIVGFAGLPPVLSAAKAGKRILLANKESLVVAGRLLIDTVKKHNAVLLPVDSEHSAIFQSLPSGDVKEAGVSKIILTASGGPFWGKRKQDLVNVTPEQACAHPNWSMGRKISVDSATLMNKGLEVIEAWWLFQVPVEQIDVVVHPQSVIHSMVQYCDGSVIAQMGIPDMQTPIAYALSWPNRIQTNVQMIKWTELGPLTFEAPDCDTFPCLRLAFDALEYGGDLSVILNAANEEAVFAFLENKIRFLDISKVIIKTMESYAGGLCQDLPSLLECDKNARMIARRIIAQ